MFDSHEVSRPYPGLRPFEPWESEIFFGRDAHVDRLLEILKSQHFLAVIGPSGSGKSSLVRAGLLPSLPLGAVGTGSSWRVAIMRPGDRPISGLAQALANAYDSHPLLYGSSVEAELHRGPKGLVRLVADLRAVCGDTDTNLLLLVDQFEELFTYAAVGHQHADEAEAFVDLCLEARADKSANIFVVITMRTDFLGNCVHFLKLPDAINRAQYLTPRLSRDELKEAIQGPARMFGLVVEPELLQEMLNAMGDDADQLPILQHALARMWNGLKITGGTSLGFAELKAIGGLDDALSKHAEEIYKNLDIPTRLAAEWLFRAITEQRGAESGGQAVRRPQSLEQIAAWSGIPWAAFIPVLKAFAAQDAHFISYKGQPGDPVEEAATVIDISHEALIRQWHTLRVWVAGEARAAREYSNLLVWALDYRAEKTELLRGADLARASEWLYENLELAMDWQAQASKLPATKKGARASINGPTVAWVGRYTHGIDAQVRSKQARNDFAAVQDYILRSDEIVQRVKRRERIVKATLVALSLSCIGLAFGGVWYARNADKERINTQAQLLWHPLRFSAKDVLDKDKVEGLLDLAGAQQARVMAFANTLIEKKELSDSFSYVSVPITQAMVGIDPELRDALINVFKKNLRAEHENLARAAVLGLLALEADLKPDEIISVLRAETVFSRLSIFLVDSRLLTLDQPGMTPRGITLVAGLTDLSLRLDTASATALADKLVQIMQNTADKSQIAAFGRGLAAVASKLDAAPAQVLADQLLQAMQKTTDSRRIEAFGGGLAAVASKLDAAPAQVLADQLLQAMQKTTDSRRIEAFGGGLAAVASKLDAAPAQALADQLLQAMHKTTESDRITAISRCLAAVASKLDTATAQVLANQLLHAMQKTTDSRRIEAFGRGLAAVASKLDAAPAQVLADQLLQAMQKTTDSRRIEAFGGGLAAVASKLDAAPAQVLADQLLQAMQKTTESDRITAISRCLEAVASKLDVAPAQVLADQLLQAMQKTTESDRLKAISRCLEAVASKLDAAPAQVLADQLLQAMQKTTESDRITAISRCLAAVASKLDAAPAQVLADQLLQALQKSTGTPQAGAYGKCLKSLAVRLADAGEISLLERIAKQIRASRMGDVVQTYVGALVAGLTKFDLDAGHAKQWIELCKYPFPELRDAVTDAVRRANKDAPPKDRGFWAFMDWAIKKYPGLDVTSRIAYPPNSSAPTNIDNKGWAEPITRRLDALL
jgi:DNA-binding FrmR family transcriptional regulator